MSRKNKLRIEIENVIMQMQEANQTMITKITQNENLISALESILTKTDATDISEMDSDNINDDNNRD